MGLDFLLPDFLTQYQQTHQVRFKWKVVARELGLISAAKTGLRRGSKAQAGRIQAIGFRRLGREAVGHVPDALMLQLDAALRLHLAL